MGVMHDGEGIGDRGGPGWGAMGWYLSGGRSGPLGR